MACKSCKDNKTMIKYPTRGNKTFSFDCSDKVLTTVEGSGSGEYPPGTCVSVVANDKTDEEKIFCKWVGDIEGLQADIYTASNIYCLGSKDATIEATYCDKPTFSVNPDGYDFGTNHVSVIYNKTFHVTVNNTCTACKITPVKLEYISYLDNVWNFTSSGHNFSVNWEEHLPKSLNGGYVKINDNYGNSVDVPIKGVKEAGDIDIHTPDDPNKKTLHEVCQGSYIILLAGNNAGIADYVYTWSIPSPLTYACYDETDTPTGTDKGVKCKVVAASTVPATDYTIKITSDYGEEYSTKLRVLPVTIKINNAPSGVSAGTQTDLNDTHS